MRAWLERWLARRWYGGEPPGVGLRALAGAYRVARGLRGAEVPQRLPVPVLVVGNFTAGGTGKTPLVIAIACELAARARFVSAGHGVVVDERIGLDAAAALRQIAVRAPHRHAIDPRREARLGSPAAQRLKDLDESLLQ